MADRTVIVRLQAEVSAYKAAMNQAAASTTRVGAAAEASAAASTAAANKQIASARSVTAATEKQAVASTLASKKQLTAAEAGVVATTKQTSAFKGMGVMIGALGLAAFAKASVDAFKQVTTEVATMRRVTGGAPEDVSRLRYALKLTGVDIDQFARSAGIFDKKMVAASVSTEKTAALNQKLGTSFQDAEGKVRPLIELLPEIGEKFKTMGTGPESAALALDLFGRAGRSMLPFLAKGKEGIDALMASTAVSSLVSEAQIQKNKELAVSQRKLSEAVTALEMSFGSALVPVLTSVADAMKPVIDMFNAAPGGIKSTVVYVGAAAVAYRLLAPAAAGAKGALAALTGMFTTTAAATTADTAATEANTRAKIANASAPVGKPGVLGAVGNVGGALAALAAVSLAVGSVERGMTNLGEQSGPAVNTALAEIGKTGVVTASALHDLGAQGDNFGNMIKESLDPTVIDRLNAFVNWVPNHLLFGQAGDQVQDFAAVMDTADKQMAEMVASGNPEQAALQFQGLAKSFVEAGRSPQDLMAALPQYIAAIGGAIAPLTEMGQAAADMGDDLSAAGEELKALQQLMSGAVSADAAITSWRQFTAGLKENGNAWDGVSNKAIANRAAIMSYASAAVQAGGNAADAIERVGAKMGLSAAQTTHLGQKLLTVDGYAAALGARNVSPKVGADTGQAKSALGGILNQLGNVGASRPNPKVGADTGQAKSALGGILNQLGNVTDKSSTVTITTVHKSIWATATGRALGGPVGSDLPYLIGEQGPELFMPGATGFITPARQTRAYLAGGGLIAGAFKKGGAVAAAKAAAEVKATPAAANAAIAAGGKAAKIYTKAHPKSAAAAVARAGAAASPAQTSFESERTSFDSASADSGMSDAERAAQEAAQAAERAAQELAAARKSVADAFRSAASITGFSFTQHASDLEAVVTAQNSLISSSDALAVARGKVNTASRADRPDAIRALADANQKYAAATAAVADAKEKESKSKVTPENILGSMKSRLAMMQGFIGNLGTLKARGLHPAILTDIIASGLVAGSEMAAALVGAGDLSGFNATQQAILDTSAQLGIFSTDITIGPRPSSAPTSLPDPAPIPVPVPIPRWTPAPRDLPSRARGGPVQAGRAYLVGEDGMETFVPASPGTIVPAGNHAGATSTFQAQNFTASQPLQLTIDSKRVWDGIVDYNVASGFTLRALAPS